VVANRSVDTDQIDKFNARVGMVMENIAYFRRLDVSRSRLKKCMIFEIEPNPEEEAVQQEYLNQARTLLENVRPLEAESLNDRQICDPLGCDCVLTTACGSLEHPAPNNPITSWAWVLTRHRRNTPAPEALIDNQAQM
jgi:hypothetical protein